LTLSSLVSPFLTADLVFLILHFTRPERAADLELRTASDYPLKAVG
jgi:hypothetical protein